MSKQDMIIIVDGNTRLVLDPATPNSGVLEHNLPDSTGNDSWRRTGMTVENDALISASMLAEVLRRTVKDGRGWAIDQFLTLTIEVPEEPVVEAPPTPTGGTDDLLF